MSQKRCLGIPLICKSTASYICNSDSIDTNNSAKVKSTKLATVYMIHNLQVSGNHFVIKVARFTLQAKQKWTPPRLLLQKCYQKFSENLLRLIVCNCYQKPGVLMTQQFFLMTQQFGIDYLFQYLHWFYPTGNLYFYLC